MSKEKLGHGPAYPFEENYEGNYGKCRNNHFGMSKRFYAACAAMQGILANQHLNPNGITPIKTKIKLLYEYVDELLKQENE